MIPMTNAEAGIVIACAIVILFTIVFSAWWRFKH
jgi:hypothetical protein